MLSKTYYTLMDPHPLAVVTACGDPRFQRPFKYFTREELGLQRRDFVPIKIAGGGSAILAHPQQLKDEFVSLVRQIRFYISHFGSIRRVILIGHEDCGFYRGISGLEGLADKEREDLPVAMNMLRQSIDLHIVIEAYYAKFVDLEKTQITFQEVYSQSM
jgi:carbonic anhydrase